MTPVNAAVGEPGRRPVADEACIPIRGDADVVLARRSGREISARAGFPPTDLTLIATAISEVTRNIVRFAGSGQVAIGLVEDHRPGVLVVARDNGPGIAYVDRVPIVHLFDPVSRDSCPDPEPGRTATPPL